MRLKVSLETALWLQTGAHSVPVHFHHPGGELPNQTQSELAEIVKFNAQPEPEEARTEPAVSRVLVGVS